MQAPGWPRSSSVCHRNKEPIPVPTGPMDTSRASATAPTTADGGASAPSGQLLGSCIEAAADALIANAAQLDELDRAVGDGDCGSTLATAARAIQKVLEQGLLEQMMAFACVQPHSDQSELHLSVTVTRRNCYSANRRCHKRLQERAKEQPAVHSTHEYARRRLCAIEAWQEVLSVRSSAGVMSVRSRPS